MAAKEKSARESLEGMSKDELVTRAEALGIEGARKFTKLELVDEIVRSTGDGDRGFLGRARDLLRDVVEKGLARAAQGSPLPVDDAGRAIERARVPTESTPAAPVPTVTLAEIFLAQGHVGRARAILEEVVRATPDDAAAGALLARIVSRSEARGRRVEPSPSPALEIEPEIIAEASRESAPSLEPEVPAMLDDAPFPARYDVDECVALAVDETTVYVYWEARRATTERARRVMQRGAGAVVEGELTSTLRVLVVEPRDEGPRVTTRDFEIVDLEYGEYFVRDLPGGSIVRAAIGVRKGDRFLPIAHTLDVEAPAAGPSRAIARDVVVWSEEATRPESGDEPASFTAEPLARDAGLLGLPPVPPAPGESADDAGRGLSSAELARRARVARGAAARAGRGAQAEEHAGASDQLARPPSSASWLEGR